MRFHKAKKVSRGDAKLIIRTATSSLNDNLVISQNDVWYDVRSMTTSELEDFVNDLLRAEFAKSQSGLITPH
jgi:hypothetical protein